MCDKYVPREQVVCLEKRMIVFSDTMFTHPDDPMHMHVEAVH